MLDPTSTATHEELERLTMTPDPSAVHQHVEIDPMTSFAPVPHSLIDMLDAVKKQKREAREPRTQAEFNALRPHWQMFWTHQRALNRYRGAQVERDKAIKQWSEKLASFEKEIVGMGDNADETGKVLQDYLTSVHKKPVEAGA